jgi:hypothetical protein
LKSTTSLKSLAHFKHKHFAPHGETGLDLQE